MSHPLQLAMLAMPLSAWALRAFLDWRSKSVASEEYPQLWFLHLRISSWLVVVYVVIWLQFMLGWHLKELGFIDNILLFTAVAGAQILCPPFLAQLAYQLATRKMLNRMRGSTWRIQDTFLQWLWVTLGVWTPGILSAYGLFALFDGDYEMAGAASGLSVFLFLFCSGRNSHSAVMRLEPLHSGILRDRAFAIAKRAGVPLRQFFLVRGTRGPV